MAVDDKIRYEKLQYDINREAAKISAMSSGKVDKYHYLIGEEILQSDQSRIIEQAKCPYSPLRKAFEKQKKKRLKNEKKTQIDTTTNKNKILEALTNKDDH